MRKLPALIAFLALAVLLASGSLAEASAPWGELSSSPRAAAAQFSAALVDVQARETKAKQSVQIRQAYFAGKGNFDAAFPHLVGAHLEKKSVLTGRLLALDDRASLRAGERQVPLPDFDRRLLASWDRALERTHAAEEEADSLERRLLAGLRARFDQNPDLARALSVERRALSEALQDETAGSTELSDLERAAVARDAAAADAALRGLEVLFEHLRDAAVIRGAPAYDPSGDLLGLEDPWTVRRVELALPYVDEAHRVECEAALVQHLNQDALLAARAALEEEQRRLEEEQRTPPSLPLTEARAARDDAVAERTLAKRAVEAAPDGPAGSLAAARKQLLEIELSLADVTLERAQIGVQEAERDGLDADAQSRLAADQAAQLAAQAQLLQEQGSQYAEEAAEVYSGFAASKNRRSGAYKPVADAQKRIEVDRAREERLDGLEAAVEALDTPLTADTVDLEETYAAWRALTQELRDQRDNIFSRINARARGEQGLAETKRQISRDRAAIRSYRSKLGSVSDADLRKDMRHNLVSWEKSLQVELWIAKTYSRLTTEQHATTLRQLNEAARVHRVLYEHAPRSVRLADEQAYLLGDLVQELRLVLPMMGAALRDSVSHLTTLPGARGTSGLILTVLSSSFWTLVLLGSWWFARSKVPSVVKGGLAQARRQGWLDLRPIELKSMHEPGVRFVSALIDLVLGYSLIFMLGHTMRPLGLVLLAYLQVALYRALVSGFDLAIVPHPQIRPALRAFRPDVFKLARRTVQAAVLWFISRGFLVYLFFEVLPLDTWARGVRWAFGWLFVGLFLWLMHRWEPYLRERIARQGQDNRVVTWLASEPQWTYLRAGRAIVALCFVMLTLSWDLLNRMASERQELGRLLNVLSRYQMVPSTDEGEAPAAEVPEEIAAAVRARECPEGAYVRRAVFETAFERELKEWVGEQRRGLVALVSDHGAGTKTVLDYVCRHIIPKRTDHIRRLKIARRLTAREDFLRWLADTLGLEALPETQDEAIAAIEAELKPGVYVIEDAHMAFLRTVGGFGALRALIYVLNGASSRHFWLVDFHRPAWAYLSRLGALVNTEVFRDVLYIDPFSELEVEELTTRRLAVARVTPNFRGLLRQNVLGGDPDVELERTVRTFYRLLAEASEGNPTVALDLFTRCLAPGAEPGEVEVNMHADLRTVVLDKGVSDEDLFTLVAVRTQAEVLERELVQITNLSPGLIRATVKHLIGLGLLCKEAGTVSINASRLPTINLTLRRRRYIPWEV